MKILLIILFIYFNYNISTFAQINVETHNAGAIFQNSESIYLISGRARIIIVLNIDDLYNQHNILIDNINKIHFNLMDIIKRHDDLLLTFQNAYSTSQDIITAYFKEFELLSFMIPRKLQNSIKKRSLLPFAGRLQHFLYGTLTDDDKAEIITNYNNVITATNNLDTILNNSIIYVKGMEENIQNNTNILKNVSLDFLNQIKALQDDMSRDNKLLSDNIDNIKLDINFLSLLNQLNVLINKARMDLINFRLAITESVRSHLSQTLLPPQNFINILNKLENKLPYDFQFFEQINYQTIESYYLLSFVELFDHEENLILVISLPLTSPRHVYNPYQITPIPFYQQNIHQYVQWDLHKFLYQSIDKQNYFLTEEPLVCLNFQITKILCEYKLPIYQSSIQTCEQNLFFNKSTDNCARNILPSLVPFFKRIDSDILFSTADKTTATLICYFLNNTVITQNLILNGHGILKNCLECSVHGENFYLHSDFRVNIKSNLTLNFNTAVLHGSIPPPLNLTNSFLSLTDLNNTLLSIPQTYKSPVNLDKLMQELEKNKLSHYNLNSVKFWSIFSPTVILIIILICFILYICYSNKLFCFNSQQGKQSVNINLNKAVELPNFITKVENQTSEM